MTLWRWLFGCQTHTRLTERHGGLLYLVCQDCGHRLAYGLQDRPTGYVASVKAVAKPNRPKRVKPAAVLPMRRVK